MKKILVFGGAGLVGSKFIELFSHKFQFLAPDISEIDILNKDQVSKTFEQFNPDTVINFAAITNGEKAESPYSEEDKPNPINWYGQTKLFGEQFVLESGCFCVIIRICMPFSSFYD